MKGGEILHKMNTENTEVKKEEEKKSNKKEVKEENPQNDKYLLTINNPEKYGMSHDNIKKILVHQFKTFKYAAMVDEQGSTYHTHVLVCFDSRVRFSKVKKAFPMSHIDPVKGLVSENILYLRKEGKWEDTNKKETNLPDTFEEIGIRPPDSRGKDPAMSDLFRMVNDGMSNFEILSENQDYILQIDKIDKLRTMLLTEKYKGILRENLRVIYIFGVTGSGKTYGILKEHNPSNVYRVTDYQHPFDSYACQPVICFEEFRSLLKLSDMLNYMDVYPVELPARFSNKFACFETVYIVSNWSLEEQYTEIQKDHASSWQAFLRRIHEVREYKGRGNVVVYDSVEAYFNRTVEFEEISDNTEIPFETPFPDIDTEKDQIKLDLKEDNEDLPFH